MRTWIDLVTVPIPRRVQRLPRDGRGYPIASFVMRWQDGTPDHRTIDPSKWSRLLQARCCGICGEVLGARVAFVGGPLSVQNRLFTDLPMHRDCAEYAVRVCPFLAAPSFAYRGSTPAGTMKNEYVVPDRPDLFGLAISKEFHVVHLPAGNVAIHAAPFEHLEWWKQGQRQEQSA